MCVSQSTCQPYLLTSAEDSGRTTLFSVPFRFPSPPSHRHTPNLSVIYGRVSLTETRELASAPQYPGNPGARNSYLLLPRAGESRTGIFFVIPSLHFQDCSCELSLPIEQVCVISEIAKNEIFGCDTVRSNVCCIVDPCSKVNNFELVCFHSPNLSEIYVKTLLKK